MKQLQNCGCSKTTLHALAFPETFLDPAEAGDKLFLSGRRKAKDGFKNRGWPRRSGFAGTGCLGFSTDSRRGNALRVDPPALRFGCDSAALGVERLFAAIDRSSILRIPQ